MLYDKARIFAAAGAGGNGSLSFRREAHVPRGGPDGGDGGRGGDVVIVCDASLRDLQSFRRRARYRAPDGGNGGGSLRHGANGEELRIGVPPGTQVTTESGDRHDLVRSGQRVVIAGGGSGGRGNKRYATPTRQAPRFAERGLAGEEGWVELRLKLLADVGLVGLPNAGKSSLLARITRAAPKIAAYPFTTLEPVLGTLEGERRQLIIADIPGLIEGASEGAGLGHDFLAHVERTRLLVHVLDLAPVDGSTPEENHATIELELERHDPRLAALPRVLALSKADLVTPEQADRTAGEWRARLGPDVPVIATSSVTRAGLDALAAELLRRVPLEDADPLAPELAEHLTFRPAARRGFHVERTAPGSFRVIGEGIDRLIARHDLENDEAMVHVESRLRRIGVLRALEDQGFTAGDEVEIAGVVFELDPE
ncbi:MAG: GTPase [Solirubrobacteraceae bacterium]|nr:GTPase [Solirubrobacteraceae bacterium]